MSDRSAAAVALDSLPEGAQSGTDPVALQFEELASRYAGRDLANAMSVDVEDYFQVSAFENTVDRSEWSGLPSRVQANVHRILDLFDEHDTKATFFTLGWVCRSFPQLVREIVSRGHELGSHGYDHKRVWSLGPEKFAKDTRDTKALLEDVGGTAVIGYRAPSFSIGNQSLWAYDILADAGFEYSSSVFPIQHDHYGLPDAPRFPFRVLPADILEIPMSTVRWGGRNFPCSGGGWFRLLPFMYSKHSVRRINRSDRMPAMFYFHPWEMDPDQPRVSDLPLKSRFRHYVNLDRFEARLSKLLDDSRWSRIDSVYLER